MDVCHACKTHEKLQEILNWVLHKWCGKFMVLKCVGVLCEGQSKDSIKEKCLKSINMNHNEKWGDKEWKEIMSFTNVWLISICLTSNIAGFALHLFWSLARYRIIETHFEISFTYCTCWQYNRGLEVRHCPLLCVCVVGRLVSLALIKWEGSWLSWANCTTVVNKCMCADVLMAFWPLQARTPYVQRSFRMISVCFLTDFAVVNRDKSCRCWWTRNEPNWKQLPHCTH